MVRLITFNGETKSLLEWSRTFGVAPKTLRERLKKFPVEVAFTMPVSERHQKMAIARHQRSRLGTDGGD
jgi:hypothetical protein